MTTRDEAWTRVAIALWEADSIAFDGCHKIYVLMDEEQTREMTSYGYAENGAKLLPVNDLETAFATVKAWFEESCGLRFINSVKSPGDNKDFTTLIGQGEEDEWE